MTDPAVAIERVRDDVAALVLDRPGRGNALSVELVEGLLDGLERVFADRAVTTLVLRSSGRHFCTGFDLSDLDAETDASLLARFARNDRGTDDQIAQRIRLASRRSSHSGRKRQHVGGFVLAAPCAIQAPAFRGADHPDGQAQPPGQ